VQLGRALPWVGGPGAVMNTLQRESDLEDQRLER